MQNTATTHTRYLDFMAAHLQEACHYELPAELRGELETAILHLEARGGGLVQTERACALFFGSLTYSTHFTRWTAAAVPSIFPRPLHR
jgi:hypothetical protein